MSEKSSYIHLRNNLPLNPRDRFDRVENLVTPGMPDVNYCISGHEGWIECKAPTLPKRASTPLFGSNHPVTLNQRNWMLMQKQAGGTVWIYIRADKNIMLIDGALADTVNKMPLADLMRISVWAKTGAVKGNEWLILKSIIAKGN